MWKWNEKKEQKPRQVNYLWVLAGGYLAYLGGELIYDVIRGEATMQFWSILAAVVFILVGVWLCLREWKVYRYGTKEQQEALPENTEGEASAADESENPEEIAEAAAAADEEET